MTRKRFVAWPTLLVCVGCSSTIHKTDTITSPAQTIAVDARQRFLVTSRVPLGQNDADKKALQKFCLEPSPDVFSVLSAAFEGSAKYKDQVSASLKSTLSEAAATIGSRTETIQLLRDAMYRVCELGLNDGLQPGEALDLHKHYQKSMVTLAAVAALADAARPVQVALTGRASITAGELTAELSDKLDQQKKELKKRQDSAAATAKDLGASIDNVCAVQVKDEADCKTDAAKCNPTASASDPGVGLCASVGKNPPAALDDEKAKRAASFCEKQDTEVCKTFKEKKAADTDAQSATKDTQDAVNQLQTELDDVRNKSEISSSTTVTSLAPAAVQPRPENVAAVAKIVEKLVTEVYADEHVGVCLQLLKTVYGDEKEQVRLTKKRESLSTEKAKINLLKSGTVDDSLLNEIVFEDPDAKAKVVEYKQKKQPALLAAALDAEISGIGKKLPQVEDRITKGQELYKYCLKISSSFEDASNDGPPKPQK